MKKFWLAYATGLGSGLAPVASGTFGTLVGIPIVIGLSAFFPPWVMLAVTAVMFFIGVYATKIAMAHYEKKDPGQVVIDEICGFMIAMYIVPLTWQHLLLAFLAFRVFDIIKPWPAYGFDKMDTPWGVMLDDIAAGVYANIVVQLVMFAGFLPARA